MASDSDYASFLEKANQDTSITQAQVTSSTPKTKAIDAEVPTALQSIEAYYVSDADEPFEPVSLKWEEDRIPDEGTTPPFLPLSSSFSLSVMIWKVVEANERAWASLVRKADQPHRRRP